MQSVKDQYEAFPYPPRNPEDEKHRLIMNPAYTVAAIDHLIYGGRRDWAKPFRVLVAGGGTGDAVIGIAQQMANTCVSYEIVYLDLSVASRRIAEERAQVRGLSNIVFQTGSLLDLDPPANGLFDFINCIGVLHHLEDPAAGLRALNSVLVDDGGMNLMVYATLGRTGVYPMQKMLRSIAPASLPAAERVSIARRLIADLPETNWLSKSPHIGDHRPDSADADIFDLLLHSVDRSYLISEVDELISAQGLRINGFLQPFLYDPGLWCRDQEIVTRAMALDPIQRASFTENLTGIIKQHIVFMTRTQNPIRMPELNAGSIMIWGADFNDVAPDAPITMNFSLQETMMSVAFDAAESAVIRLIDGKKTIEEIWRVSGQTEVQFRIALAKVWRVLHGAGGIFLRAG